MADLYIPVILGTGREGRRSEPAARFVLEQAEKAGLETELIDVRDYPSPVTARVEQEGFDAGGATEKMRRADGYVIVSPEYNHGYPGELKIFLDHFYPELDRKPVGLCGVSNGPWGGARMVEGLRIVLGAFGCVTPKRTMLFPKAGKLFDDDGRIDPEQEEANAKRVAGMLEEVIWWAKAAKTMRGSED